MITIADALREEGIQIGRAQVAKELAEAFEKLEAERAEREIKRAAERAEHEAELVKERLLGFRLAILALKARGSTFEDCVEALKISDEKVRQLIQVYPEVVTEKA